MWDPRQCQFLSHFGQGQALYGIIAEPNKQPWVIAGVYANTQSTIRRRLWVETSEVTLLRLPTLIAGDFNSILWREDKKGGRPFRITDGVNEFRQWVQSTALQQLPHSGDRFTWCNNRYGQDRVWEILDRGFVNSEWMRQFPNARFSSLPRSISDHAPMLLDTNPLIVRGPVPFRFERFWMERPDLPDIVTQAWSRRPRFQSSPLSMFSASLRALKDRLRHWNKEVIGNLPHQIIQTEAIIQSLSSQEVHQSAPPAPASSINLRLHINHLVALERQVEIFWAQRARTTWLCDDDLLIVSSARPAQCGAIRDILDQFTQYTGLQFLLDSNDGYPASCELVELRHSGVIWEFRFINPGFL
ncbi:hypothetical protein QJS10_CPA08g01934 [Acorus calamus]|uniref:Endonuclease/exonuclease/phosphatase domain-containing protein n=1 Tax=Acorus calamus TaxID=4465 RepID=A0AAV9DHJ8_ACOCL|nr:hypothetical protein QJS10_CPB13g00291 [Acorus calamus]KAK1309740.1 hypothetical protein QJS10_CPA08g01934 [Acorus calamus]